MRIRMVAQVAVQMVAQMGVAAVVEVVLAVEMGALMAEAAAEVMIILILIVHQNTVVLMNSKMDWRSSPRECVALIHHSRQVKVPRICRVIHKAVRQRHLRIR